MYDYETVKGWAEEVIAEKGKDFVYESPTDGKSCFYAVKEDDGTLVPSCLIGIMLHRHGLLDLEKVYNGSFGHDYNSQRISALLDEYQYNRPSAPTADPALFTVKAKTFMAWLQSGQDSRKTWGTALNGAVEWCLNYDEDDFRVFPPAD